MLGIRLYRVKRAAARGSIRAAIGRAIVAGVREALAFLLGFGLGCLGLVISPGSLEAIAHAVNGVEPARIAWIVSQLGAQVLDVESMVRS